MAPPEGRPLPEVIEGRITIVVEDDVSTGDIAPDGAIGMSLWSDTAECAKHMFRRQDLGFHDRALARGGGLIVAATTTVRARRANMRRSCRSISASAPWWPGASRASTGATSSRRASCRSSSPTPPTTAASSAARHGSSSAREVIESGEEELTAHSDAGRDVPLRAELSPRDRETLLAGGLIRLARAGGIRVVQEA